MKYLFLLIPLFSACSSMSEREKAWQTAHIIDVAQTYNMSQSPCHWEADLITSSIIGENPEGDDVILWGIASAVIYHYADDFFPETVMNMQFMFKVGAVNNNTEIGLTPSGYRCNG